MESQMADIMQHFGFEESDRELTIKEASNEQLDALIKRLGKELIVQDQIAMLKRHACDGHEGVSYENPGISTEVPIKDLYHKNELEETLKHHGILGMKWGIRNDKRSGNKPRIRKGHADAAKITKQKNAKKPISKMSNQKLQEVITRKNLENNYKSVNQSEAEKFILEVLKDSAKVTAKKYVTKGMIDLVDFGIKRASKK